MLTRRRVTYSYNYMYCPSLHGYSITTRRNVFLSRNPDTKLMTLLNGQLSYAPVD